MFSRILLRVVGLPVVGLPLVALAALAAAAFVPLAPSAESAQASGLSLGPRDTSLGHHGGGGP